MAWKVWLQAHGQLLSPAEEKDLCNYEFVPLLPFPTLLQPPGLLQCSHRPPGRSPASKEPGPVAAADHYGHLELLQPVFHPLKYPRQARLDFAREGRGWKEGKDYLGQKQEPHKRAQYVECLPPGENSLCQNQR